MWPIFFPQSLKGRGSVTIFFFIPPFFLLRSRTSWAHRCTRCCCEHWARECTGHRLLHNRRTRQVSPWAAGRAPLPCRPWGEKRGRKESHCRDREKREERTKMNRLHVGSRMEGSLRGIDFFYQYAEIIVADMYLGYFTL